MADEQKPADDTQPEEAASLTDAEKKLAQCETEKKEYLEGWQRAKADFINYKNEEGRRMEDMARYVSTGLLYDMLPVLDSFDLAVGHGLPPDAEKGVLLIRSQFEDVLKKRGLERIAVSPGDAFNPEWHESIGEIESPHAPGMIAEEVQRGYTLRGKVIRPVRVRLAKAPIQQPM